MDEIRPGPRKTANDGLNVDLEDRLIRLRERMAAEGRTTAVSALDKAIATEKKRRSRNGGDG